MTLSSRSQSPSPTGNTPTVTTSQLAAIRAAITPNRGWWQFELRPWHYWTAIASTAVVTGGFIALVATTGLHR